MQESQVIPWETIQGGEMIGSGAAGTVFRTVYQGHTVAVKKFNVVLLDKDDLRDFLT